MGLLRSFYEGGGAAKFFGEETIKPWLVDPPPPENENKDPKFKPIFSFEKEKAVGNPPPLYLTCVIVYIIFYILVWDIILTTPCPKFFL